LARHAHAVRRRIPATAAVLACVASGAAGTPVAVGASSPEPERAVAMLNEWRMAVGVPPVAHDPEATEGCRLHTEYRRLNPDAFGHHQDPARPGYTPEGHRAATRSVLGYVSDGRGPYVFEGAVFHRTNLLAPRLTRSGFWSEHDTVCMSAVDVDRSPAATFSVHPYPWNGQTGVATSFDCLERPNPCDSIPGGGSPDRPVGVIPSVQFDGPWFSAGTPVVDHARLTPDGGAPVDATVFDARLEVSRSLDGGVAVAPHRPLAPETWYTLEVRGAIPTVDATTYAESVQPFDVVTRFRTGPADRETFRTVSPPASPTTLVRPRLRAVRLSGLRLSLTVAVPRRMVGGRLRVRAVGARRVVRTIRVRTRVVRIVVAVPPRLRTVRVEPLPAAGGAVTARPLVLRFR
jgi:hypothetical protein